MTYSLVEKHVWEEGVDAHHTKCQNGPEDNPKDCNEDDVPETGLVWTEMFADHADVLSSCDHHEADKDSI